MIWNTVSKSIRTNILIGLLLITPLVITLMIINFLFTFITNSLVPQAWLQTHWGLLYRVAALAIVVLGLYVIGILARNIIGKSMYRVADRLMTRIPVIKSIYIAIRRLSESIISSKNEMFKQVVLIQYPRLGIYSLGFLTARLPLEFSRDSLGMAEGEDYVNVFVPTAPNPTSGFLLIVARHDIKPLKISVVDAMKMVMSVGAVLPAGKDIASQSLLDHLDKLIHPAGQGKTSSEAGAAASGPSSCEPSHDP